MIVVRYADDLVAGFQHADAERFLRDFQERLAKFGLEIQPEKTRLIEFGRFARLPAARAKGNRKHSRSSGSRTTVARTRKAILWWGAQTQQADEGETAADQAGVAPADA